MALDLATQFGSYEITEAIGAGGMGEVYRATDSKLKRDVAIKVLPASFATDDDRLARFQREAEILASLNHPNIAQIYGLEQRGESIGLIMELIDGPTLAERIAEGPLDPSDALGIAHQIINALEAAHQQQIVHRDLKPANIKLKPDGTAKVLDFGIAKPIAATAISGGPLNTPTMTETGIIMGTAAYMSPEQARGQFVDERTDIWAFGCVLFEMLTGQPAFLGEDVAVTLARILERDTNLDSLPGAISPSVSQTIKLCLKKDPKHRVADIRDVRLALAGEFDPGPAHGAVEARNVWYTAIPVGLAASAVAGVAVWMLMAPGQAPDSSGDDIIRFTVNLDQEASTGDEGSTLSLGAVGGIAWGWPARNALAFSNDGTMIVFAGWQQDEAGDVSSQLYLKRLDQDRVEPIAGTENAYGPFFSPDDEWLGFGQGTALRRVSLATRNAEVIVADTEIALRNLFSAEWLEDQTILVGTVNGLYRVGATGGVETLAEIDRTTGPHYYWLHPRMLPDTNVVLFHAISSTYDAERAEILALNLDTGEQTSVLSDGTNPIYVAETGHLLFARRGALMAAPFDTENLLPIGQPIVVLENLMHSLQMPFLGDESGLAQISLSRSGHLIYAPGGVYREILESIQALSDNGQAETLVANQRDYGHQRVSPDGNRIVSVAGVGFSNRIYLHDLERGITQRLEIGGFSNATPAWSPDGQRIAFNSDHEDDVRNIYSMPVDGSEAPVRLAPSDREQYLSSWSSDGVIVYLTEGDGGTFEFWTLPPDGEPEFFLRSEPLIAHATFSPDGRWLAYSRRTPSSYETYVRPYPEGEPATLVTPQGSSPLWSPDGRTIYFTRGATNPPSLWRVNFTPGTPPEISRAEMHFEQFPFTGSLPVQDYDVLPDGRIVVSEEQAVVDAFNAGTRAPTVREQNRAGEIRVILNFVETLRQRAGR